MRWISLAVLLASARVAAARCETTSITLFASRMLVEPSPDDTLGADVTLDGPAIGWGRCVGLRHRIRASTVESPDFGRGGDGALAAHFLRYELAWHAELWSVYAGVRGLSLWFGDLRLATPVAGLRSRLAPQLAFGLAVESAGMFAFAKDGRRSRRDLSLEASLAYPADARYRGELRARVRDYDTGEMTRVRDLTVTAGLGFAFAARDRLRALPGTLGLAVRRDDGVQVLFVAELGLAALAD